MSGDEDRRRNRRIAIVGAADGDQAGAARAERDSRRTGDETTRQGWIAQRVGVSVYLEGIRINWRGTLSRILYHADGKVSDLVFKGPCQRIGDMEATGPTKRYTLTVNADETLVPFETVIGMFEDKGFNGKAWPKIEIES